ncbi:MAG: membrane protein insertase YidC [Spirochaetes bacterium]|jgi:YidC/Oxa1 family membrane protein insertase|nr:membrane protein insertase YidC [Spirochaetota bacterium]
MEKRTLLAVVLALGVWLLWSYFFVKPHDQHQEQVPVQEERVEKAADAPSPREATRPAARTAISVKGASREETVSIKTDNYTVVLSNRGAVVKSFKYNERGTELVVENSGFEAKGVFDFPLHLSENEFLQGGALDEALWGLGKVTRDEVQFVAAITLQDVPVRVEKTYRFIKEADYFTVSFRIQNAGNRSVVLPGGAVIFSASDFLGPAMDFDNTYNQVQGIYSVDNSFEKTSKGSGFFTKEGIVKKENGVIQWVGMMSRYFLLIMIPEDFSGTGIISDNRPGTGFRAGMYLPLDEFRAGDTLSRNFKVYAGEKNKDKLRAVSESVIDAADVSKWIEPIRDLLLWALLKINILFGNFGWSLVVFSIITKIILLPLTQKSTESMKKLQALNPQITELREKYKDKPEVLNKKIMDLYKKNKVNPASGCLPLLLQMPFFFALYSALINAIDLWQAPFILWIQDLSLPDTIFKIYGFNINILPIIMTGTTYLQQRMTTGEAVGQQQKMLMFMPLIFIVIFWNMPSGLVLYWIMQNALQILHQLYINRKGSVKKAE